MIALLQRVAQASVTVAGERTGAIGPGLLVFVCAERGDTDATADRLLARLLSYRVFSDEGGRMNRPVTDIDGAGTPGALLVVPQFTLAADTTSGTRPRFTPAAAPAEGRRLYERFVEMACARHPSVATGRFGANMQVLLVNDGPVTLWLRVPPA
jgi:D-tyrosyl-tRNA(Tyr) deacylase